MAAPTSPGGYVGEHRNGYFWNGISWDEGGTVSGTAPAPSTAFGGTIINQQNATPAPAPASATAAAKRASILATILRQESGGRNIPQAIVDINTQKGTPAQGYFQIINPTWSEFGGDKTGHKSAIDAPYDVQLQVAQNIPVARWGPNTQAALRAAGYEPKPGETLGQMLTRYGEDPNATKPEDLGGSTVPAAPVLPPGLLASSTPTPATPLDGAKVDKEKEEAAAFESLTRQGQQMMAAAEPEAAPPVQPARAGGLLQAATAVPLPDFTKPAPTLPDFLEMLSQQRLRRA